MSASYNVLNGFFPNGYSKYVALHPSHTALVGLHHSAGLEDAVRT